jgi:hypothetical protein
MFTRVAPAGRVTDARVTAFALKVIGGVTRVMPRVSSTGWSTTSRYEPGGTLSVTNRPSESEIANRPAPSIWITAPMSGSLWTLSNATPSR